MTLCACMSVSLWACLCVCVYVHACVRVHRCVIAHVELYGTNQRTTLEISPLLPC